MKKTYKNVDLKVVVILATDIVTSSGSYVNEFDDTKNDIFAPL